METKVVLIGAGSAVFTKGLIADLIARNSELTIGLVDINPEALEVARGLAQRMIATRSAPIRIQASTERRDVLPGATAVICTVGVGGRSAWMKDVIIPRTYGIFQPVGDTTMPGGLSRALRMIPAMVAIAEDVLDICPGALFFNYSNPMSAVCRGIRKATGADVIGLCHGVNHIGHYLAKLLNVGGDDIRYNAVGLNHLTWFTELRHRGVDLMPRLIAAGRDRLAELFSGDGSPAFSMPTGDMNPFTWELLRLYGAFPAVLDRHVCEFFPSLFSREGSYYGATLGTDCFSMEETIEQGDQSFALMKAIAAGGEEIPDEFFNRSSGEHEQVVDIIESIISDVPGEYSANLPNTGQIPDLPEGAILESPAVACGSGIRAIQQRPLPAGIIATLAGAVATIETVVDAALEGSRPKFVQALLCDGSVTSVSQAAALADDLIAAHAGYLPLFAKNV